MLSINGVFGAGSGVQHDRKEPGAGANKDTAMMGGGGVGASQAAKDKFGGGALAVAGGAGFPLLSRMHIDDLMGLGVIGYEEDELEEKASKDGNINDQAVKPDNDKTVEQWKKRAQVLSKLYKSVNKESKICKKCNTTNPFFMFECRKCQFRIGKTRSDRAGTNYMTSSSRGDHGVLGSYSNMSIDNYSIVFWEFLQTNTELFEPSMA